MIFLAILLQATQPSTQLDWLTWITGNFGAPTALALVFGFFWYTGKIRTDRELREKEAEWKREREEKDARIAAQDRQIDDYVNILIGLRDVSERQVSATERMVDKLKSNTDKGDR